MIAGGGRAVENHGDQPIAMGLLKTIDQFLELVFHGIQFTSYRKRRRRPNRLRQSRRNLRLHHRRPNQNRRSLRRPSRRLRPPPNRLPRSMPVKKPPPPPPPRNRKSRTTMPMTISGQGMPGRARTGDCTARAQADIRRRRLWLRRSRDPICVGGRDQRLAVSALAQQRLDGAQDAAVETVGQDRLQAIADFDAIAMILDGEQQHDALVLALLADAPFAKQACWRRLRWARRRATRWSRSPSARRWLVRRWPQ